MKKKKKPSLLSMFQKNKKEEVEEVTEEKYNTALAVLQVVYSDNSTTIENSHFMYKNEKPTIKELRMVQDALKKEMSKKIPNEKKVTIKSVILLNVIDYIL